MEDLTKVDTGSETSGEQAAVEPSQEATAPAQTAAADTEKSEEAPVADAGGAAEAPAVVPDADESRTAYVTNQRPGDGCVCPDGRKGTVHSFDLGLICIPNQDQSDQG